MNCPCPPPQLTDMSFAQTAVLGALAGFTIFLGLPVGRMRLVSTRGRAQPRVRDLTYWPIRSPLGRRIRTHVLFCDVERLGLHDPRAPNVK